MKNFKKSLNFWNFRNYRLILLFVATAFLLENAAYGMTFSRGSSLRVPLSDKKRIEEAEDNLIEKDGDYYYSRSLEKARSGDLLGEASDLFKAYQLGSKETSDGDIVIKLAAALTGLRFCKDPFFREWFLQELEEEIGLSDVGAYLVEIFDEEGVLRDKGETVSLFNKIVMSYPVLLVKSSDTATILNRYPNQFSYFEKFAMPSLIKRKLKKDKTIRIKSIGSARGEEMATIYFYLKRAFDSHPEWGSMDEWGIKIESMDISEYAIKESKRRLLDEPSELDEALNLTTKSSKMVSVIKEIGPEKRNRIFRITKGNICHKLERDEFLKDADIVFVNTMLYLILTSSRKNVVMDILNSDAAILTNHGVFYELAKRPRQAVEILEEGNSEVIFYVSSAGEKCFQEESDRILSINESYLFDNPGEFLPTHRFFNSGIEVRKGYSRAEHVKALAEAVREGEISLSPSIARRLFYVEVMEALGPENVRYAKILLEALDDMLSDSKTPEKLPTLKESSRIESNL